MHKNDVLALCSTIVGIGSLAGDSTLGGYLDTALGNHATSITLAVIGALGVIAGQVLRVLGAPTTVTPAAPPQGAPPNG